jgi:hypothetical protein
MTDSLPDAFESAESDLDSAEETALGRALRAAYASGKIEPARHARILSAALEDPFAPAGEDELRASERLRQALEAGDERHADAALARALAVAVNPKSPRPAVTERLAERAVTRKPNVLYVTFGALALAAAAGFALVVSRPDGVAERHAVLVPSRTTEALFHEAFVTGQATERIDRIASARERDARENRYALWGVR